MGFLKRLFGGGEEAESTDLSAPDHVARMQIDEASHLAGQSVKIQVIGDSFIIESNSIDSEQLVRAVDVAIEKAPDDLNLQIAKSGALCLQMQFKTAEDVIDQILAKDPENFEARQRKQYWTDWLHLFNYPPWSETASTLHPMMVNNLGHGRSVQIVCDGIQGGIAIVRSVPSNDFPRGLSTTMRSKWEPVWSETPYGGLVPHYTVVEDNPADPYKAEAFLPIFYPSETIPLAGYWLLQRLNHMASCFIILVEGQRILYNRRYRFPTELRSTLSNISKKIASQKEKKSESGFKMACQWHMQNFDLNNVRF